MLPDNELVKIMTFKMFTPLSQIDYDIACSVGSQNEDYYFTPEDLHEIEGDDAECLEVEVEVFPELFAN